ncbi:O-antigen polymerase [Larkinella sp. C7]|uniref:O-antigen polymerase n=1 Tax=Larkinella sp. C7 TaxID=2576607 RepID=UPI0011110C4B|nr:O-antigen polymerase [Larkinella sp. C7]
MEILAEIVLVLTTIINYIIVPKQAYPPFLFSLIWSCVIMYYIIAVNFFQLDVNALSIESILIMIIGPILFSMGGVFPLIKNYSNKAQINTEYEELNKKSIICINFLFYSSLLVLPFYIRKAFELSVSAGNTNFFIGLRFALNKENEGESYGILGYFLVISFVNLILRIFYKKQLNNKLYYILSIIITAVYFVLFTGRTYMFMLVVYIYALILLKNKITKKHIGFFALSIIITFSSSALLLKKGGSDVDTFTLMGNLYKIFTRYLIGPLPALSQFLGSEREYSYGLEMFRTIHAIFYKLNLTNTQPVGLVKPFIFIPFSTNVYTIYYQYIKDFGYLGLSIFFPLGFFHSLLFKRAILRKNGFYKIAYAIFLYPIFFSFFQEQYFSLMSMWLQIFLILGVFFYFKSQTKNERIVDSNS